MNNAQLVNQDSGEVEWYTPANIIEAARQTMGGIDLDPASCHLANQTVKAATYFTVVDDGLSQRWVGRVWMNHPYGGETNPKWIGKLLAEYKAGHITQACCITYASTSETWGQLLLASPVCFPTARSFFNQEF
jgi:ParB family chromosome partitioning protein